jgi:replication-associated recombination protein RarA
MSSGEAEQIADELQRALEVVEAPERRTAVLSAVQQITLAPKLGLVYVQIDEQCSIVCEVTFADDTTWNPYAK